MVLSILLQRISAAIVLLCRQLKLLRAEQNLLALACVLHHLIIRTQSHSEGRENLNFCRLSVVLSPGSTMQSKRQASSNSSPLDDSSLLFQILCYVGAGQHLFVSPVSKLWHEINAAVPDLEMTSLVFDPVIDPVRKLWCTSQTTLYSAVCESASRVRLADACFTIKDASLARIAGTVGDVATLQVALELGLAGEELFRGAAYAGSVTMLTFLATTWQLFKQGGLPNDLSAYAASSGSVEALQWMEKWGQLLPDSVLLQAAKFGHANVLEHIYSNNRGMNASLLGEAARHGHLNAVEWLFDHGAAYDAETICGDAAESGSVQLVQFVNEKGGKLNKSTFRDAAWRGHLAICQHLHSEQCPWDVEAVAWAGCEGHTEVVKWLVEHGCPYNADAVFRDAVEKKHLAVLQYVLSLERPSSEKLTQALSAAATHHH
jgi:hypothetical protein